MTLIDVLMKEWREKVAYQWCATDFSEKRSPWKPSAESMALRDLLEDEKEEALALALDYCMAKGNYPGFSHNKDNPDQCSWWVNEAGTSPVVLRDKRLLGGIRRRGQVAEIYEQFCFDSITDAMLALGETILETEGGRV